ncbi:Hypothetical predicted protein [Cloeon dipterum]|uniref:Uncharacterized protein n=1 Tax=Cloeon dipterum TaxID=197152 RepID=A0A8S1DLH3_9INSE|nr:Hypothetical predicted protein [Cloeon dipterum]
MMGLPSFLRAWSAKFKRAKNTWSYLDYALRGKFPQTGAELRSPNLPTIRPYLQPYSTGKTFKVGSADQAFLAKRK